MELWFDLDRFWEKRCLCGIEYSQSYAKDPLIPGVGP